MFLKIVFLLLAMGFAHAQKVTIAEFGDTQGDAYAQAVIRRAALFNPDAVLIAGDLMEHGEDPAAWTNYFSWLTTAGLYSVPNTRVYPCPGGHDAINCATLADWQARWDPKWDLPGNESYYSFRKGNVFFLNVWIDYANETMLPYAVYSAQWNFARQELTNANADTTVKWIIVMWHLVPSEIASGTIGAAASLPMWMQLCQLYNADLVINGHQHVYHRTYPVAYDKGVISVDSVSGKGVVYLAASNGDSPVAAGAPFPYHAIAAGSNNAGAVPGYKGWPILKLEVDGLTLRGYGINAGDGSVFDSFVLTKAPARIERTGALPEGAGISAAPNPFNGSTFIRVGGGITYPVPVEIFNVAGRRVRAFDLPESGMDWDARSLCPGFYLVRVSLAGKYYSRTLLLTR